MVLFWCCVRGPLMICCLGVCESSLLAADRSAEGRSTGRCGRAFMRGVRVARCFPVRLELVHEGAGGWSCRIYCSRMQLAPSVAGLISMFLLFVVVHCHLVPFWVCHLSCMRFLSLGLLTSRASDSFMSNSSKLFCGVFLTYPSQVPLVAGSRSF